MPDQIPPRPEGIPGDAIIVPETRRPYVPPHPAPASQAYLPPIPPAPTMPYAPTAAQMPPTPPAAVQPGQIVPVPPTYPDNAGSSGQAVAPYLPAGYPNPAAYPAPTHNTHPSQPGYPTQAGYSAHPGYPGQHVYPAHPGYPVQPQPSQSNGVAVAGFVVGLVSVFLPLIFGLAAGAAGIVMSSVGIGRSKATGTGRGLAVAGLVLSIIGTILIF